MGARYISELVHETWDEKGGKRYDIKHIPHQWSWGNDLLDVCYTCGATKLRTSGQIVKPPGDARNFETFTRKEKPFMQVKLVQDARVAQVAKMQRGPEGFTQALIFCMQIPSLGDAWFCLEHGSNDCDDAKECEVKFNGRGKALNAPGDGGVDG